MDMIKIVAFGLVSAVLVITLKKFSPEFALVVSIAAGCMIFFTIIPTLSQVIASITDIAGKVNLNGGYILLVLKIIGISYLAEFGSHICCDAGETSLASKIELAGKVLIMFVSMPVLLSLVDLITRML